MISSNEQLYLERCIELATEALHAGDAPFGSVLVAKDGTILREERNRTISGDATQHPEFALARWAAQNLSADERAEATVYTSGEHCPMCSTAHGLAGLGPIVYISSAQQLGKWLKELNVPASPINFIPIQEIIRNINVKGPIAGLDEQVRELHEKRHKNKQKPVA